MEELQKLLDKYVNEWNTKGVYSTVLYSQIITDLDQALQLHKTQVSGSVCIDSELQMMLGDLIYQEENCYDWTDKKKIKNKINAVSILLEIDTVW